MAGFQCYCAGCRTGRELVAPKNCIVSESPGERVYAFVAEQPCEQCGCARVVARITLTGFNSTTTRARRQKRR